MDSIVVKQIMLVGINDIKEMVNCAMSYPYDVDIVSGKYIIDAKSIMGIFSLDLSQPITIKIEDTDKVTGNEKIFEIVNRLEIKGE